MKITLAAASLAAFLIANPVAAQQQPRDAFPVSAHDTILGITLQEDTLERMFAALGTAKRKRDPSVGNRHFSFGYCYCSSHDCEVRLTFDLPNAESVNPHGYVLEMRRAADQRCTVTNKLSKEVATAAGVTLGMTRPELERLLPGRLKFQRGTFSRLYQRRVDYPEPKPHPFVSYINYTGEIHYAHVEATFKDGRLTRFSFSRGGEMNW